MRNHPVWNIYRKPVLLNWFSHIIDTITGGHQLLPSLWKCISVTFLRHVSQCQFIQYLSWNFFYFFLNQDEKYNQQLLSGHVLRSPLIGLFCDSPVFFSFFLYYETMVARLKVLKGKYTPRVMIKRDKKKRL